MLVKIRVNARDVARHAYRRWHRQTGTEIGLTTVVKMLGMGRKTIEALLDEGLLQWHPDGKLKEPICRDSLARLTHDYLLLPRYCEARHLWTPRMRERLRDAGFNPVVKNVYARKDGILRVLRRP